MACPNSSTPKKARQLKSKVKSIIIFDIKNTIYKEFVLVDQTVNSAYCCDVLRRLRENVRRFHLELRRQNNWPLFRNNIPSHKSSFVREFLTRDSRPHSSYFSVSPIEDKIERPAFWHNYSDQGRITSGAEHPHRTLLPECSSKMTEALGTVQKRTTWKMMMASRPKFSFWPDGSTSPGYFGWLFHLVDMRQMKRGTCLGLMLNWLFWFFELATCCNKMRAINYIIFRIITTKVKLSLCLSIMPCKQIIFLPPTLSGSKRQIHIPFDFILWNRAASIQVDHSVNLRLEQGKYIGCLTLKSPFVIVSVIFFRIKQINILSQSVFMGLIWISE
jgi:hypothetical protein